MKSDFSLRQHHNASQAWHLYTVRTYALHFAGMISLQSHKFDCSARSLHQKKHECFISAYQGQSNEESTLWSISHVQFTNTHINKFVFSTPNTIDYIMSSKHNRLNILITEVLVKLQDFAC